MAAVEITEDFVLGKAGPVWHFKEEEQEEETEDVAPQQRRSNNSTRKFSSLRPIYEDQEFADLSTGKRRKEKQQPSFTEFDEAIFAELETSL